MSAFFTVIPIILIRYGLLSAINKDATNRASFFAPLIGKEKVASGFIKLRLLLFYYIYCYSKSEQTPIGFIPA
jgi:hypothetical protein